MTKEAKNARLIAAYQCMSSQGRAALDRVTRRLAEADAAVPKSAPPAGQERRPNGIHQP